jgi:hypothetical protein
MVPLTFWRINAKADNRMTFGKLCGKISYAKLDKAIIRLSYLCCKREVLLLYLRYTFDCKEVMVWNGWNG